MNQPICNLRIVVADDHPVIRHAVVTAVACVPGIRVAASAACGAELLAALQAGSYDLIVTDLSMQGTQTDHDGLQLVALLKRLYPSIPVIVFTMLANHDVLVELERMHVAGIVSKTENLTVFAQGLREVALQGGAYRSPAIRAILQQAAAARPAAGTRPLTAKEVEVLRLYGLGLSLTEIAARFNRSVSTVATQKANAMRKLGLHTHAELIRYARTNRLLS
jgi:two-component system, NarL family, captular synthesis response regulator RcsB